VLGGGTKLYDGGVICESSLLFSSLLSSSLSLTSRIVES